MTLCETAPAMVRKQVPNGVSLLTPLVLEMMCELDDEPDWSLQDDAAEDDNEQSVYYLILAILKLCDICKTVSIGYVHMT